MSPEQILHAQLVQYDPGLRGLAKIATKGFSTRSISTYGIVRKRIIKSTRINLPFLHRDTYKPDSYRIGEPVETPKDLLSYHHSFALRRIKYEVSIR